MEEYLGLFYRTLENIGVYLEEKNGELLIKDIIADSLTYISFFLEIENAFGIEIPDECYTDEIYSYSILEFIDKIIVKQMKGAV